MAVERIHRLIRLINLLQSGRARSGQDLTRELGVSRRTLFRDLNMLQQAGIPYYHDPRVGYRIDRGYYLPPIHLTAPETLGLMLLGKLAESRRQWPLRREALGAINKLGSTIPEPIRSTCSGLMAGVTVNHGPEPVGSDGSGYYTTLQRCIDEGRSCRITYKSPVEPEPIRCRLDPYALHFVTRSWYVFGQTDLHGQVRVFKLARLTALEPLVRVFDPPKRFSPQQKLGKAWGMIPEGRVYRVELDFSAKVAVNVSEVRWHPSQSQKLLADGRCRMAFEVDGLSEIAWWVCGYADQVVVRKPGALRQRVSGMLRLALERYERGGTTI